MIDEIETTSKKEVAPLPELPITVEEYENGKLLPINTIVDYGRIQKIQVIDEYPFITCDNGKIFFPEPIAKYFEVGQHITIRAYQDMFENEFVAIYRDDRFSHTKDFPFTEN
jgi:hypothetical protein